MLADDLNLPLLLHLPPASQLTFHTAVGAPVDAAAVATATVTARLIIDATLSGSEIRILSRGSFNLPGALLRVPSRSTSQFVPLTHDSIAVAATALSAALEGATSITAAFISH